MLRVLKCKNFKHPQLLSSSIVYYYVTGFSTVVAPLYINEISPVNLRGGLGTLNQLGITSGILISQTLGLTVVFGNVKFYHLLFGK